MNIVIVAQSGRILHQAILFAYSFNRCMRDRATLYVCMPENSKLWKNDPSVTDQAALDYFRRIGAKLVTFRNEHFGSSYPHANKIYALQCLPAGEPFIFFDSDVVLTGDLNEIDLDYSTPSALHGGSSWPRLEGSINEERDRIWQGVYRYLETDIDPSLDTAFPVGHFRRYMYFNGGFFFYDCPQKFHDAWLRNALSLLPHLKTLNQAVFPWLDQISLGVTCRQLGGMHNGVPSGTIDEAYSCHYHFVPVFYSPEYSAALDVARGAYEDTTVSSLLSGWSAFQFFMREEAAAMMHYLVENEGITRRIELVKAIKRLGVAKK